jgi:hypothetical protein
LFNHNSLLLSRFEPFFNILLGKTKHDEHPIDKFDTDKRDDEPAQAVDKQVVAQELACTDRPVLDALESEWDQKHDDERNELPRSKLRGISKEFISYRSKLRGIRPEEIELAF